VDERKEGLNELEKPVRPLLEQEGGYASRKYCEAFFESADGVVGRD
jgi:hypothetical protein